MKGQNWPISCIKNIDKISRYLLILRYFLMFPSDAIYCFRKILGHKTLNTGTDVPVVAVGVLPLFICQHFSLFCLDFPKINDFFNASLQQPASLRERSSTPRPRPCLTKREHVRLLKVGWTIFAVVLSFCLSSFCLFDHDIIDAI